MIIECTSCASKYKYDESKLVGVTSKKIKCPKCKGVIEVLNPAMAEVASTDEDRLQRKVAAVQASSYETQPSPDSDSEVPAQTMDHTASSGIPEGGPKTTKVRRDTIVPEVGPAAASSESFLKMPEYRKISLAVISGTNSGEIHQINKPRMVMGRGDDVEIIVKDPEASRAHARIDILGDRVILRDLNSTNGTFVNEQKIATT